MKKFMLIGLVALVSSCGMFDKKVKTERVYDVDLNVVRIVTGKHSYVVLSGNAEGTPVAVESTEQRYKEYNLSEGDTVTVDFVDIEYSMNSDSVVYVSHVSKVDLSPYYIK